MKTLSDSTLKSLNKNALIKTIKELQETISNINGDNQNLFGEKNVLKIREMNLQQRIDKAITLIQLIQMNDEIDWGDINTLIHILRGNNENIK